MPFVEISSSPLVPQGRPTRIFYRESGAGFPLIFLHGGWGYELYPFDADALSGRFRILIPDRTGYGRSTPIGTLPADFHSRAAVETTRFLDALGIERAILWGHSDGAVIAAMLGLSMPGRCHALILEAFHFTRNKTSSVDFFERIIDYPDGLGERTREALIRDHGPERWRQVLGMNGRAWLDIAANHQQQDLYDGKLSQLALPTLFLHGARDPRTEPGELEAVRQQLPRAMFRVIEQGGHSPHSEVAAATECIQVAREFLGRLEVR